LLTSPSVERPGRDPPSDEEHTEEHGCHHDERSGGASIEQRATSDQDYNNVHAQ